MISGNAMTTEFAYKPSLVGAPMEFHLADDALEWRRGGTGGRAPYGEIRRIRLSYRPMTSQSHRFLAEVWSEGGPKLRIGSTSVKSMFEHQRLDAEYSAFVVEFARRIGAAGRATSFETGSPALLYWPGVALFSIAALSMVGLALRAAQTAAYGGGAFIAGFLALFLWQAGNFFYRNQPGIFQPDSVPPRVLPVR